ncbi:MAG: hypothetical protein LPK45_08665, partial [Bacteroidota bacterium]|nr:hypothetical protein [Bacteroidota bacterium]MDX5431148.1 hypothetical protein [Bacteroidota bacterium]MDX5469895.1 hypothetical protein [Bacteroidota bacterium]
MPVHSEVVLNVKAQDDLLLGVFFFTSLTLLMKQSYWSGFAYMGALFSKELALPLIAVFPALDWYLGRKLNLKLVAVLGIPAVIYGVARLSVLDGSPEVEVVNNALAFADGYGTQS